MNGVHVNGAQIESNKNRVIKNGDKIVFGLNTDLNELIYIFHNRKNDGPKLTLVRDKAAVPRCNRIRLGGRGPPSHAPSRTPSMSPPLEPIPTPTIEPAVPRKRVFMSVGGRAPSRTPSTEPPSGPTLGKRTVPTSVGGASSTTPPPSGPIPTPTLGMRSSAADSPLTTSEESPILSTEDVFISPPYKKQCTLTSLDCLFDTATTETSTKMDDELFGASPRLTPQARAVLMGIKVTATEIQVLMARDEVEKEKQMIESKYQVLKNELKVKDQKLVEKEKKEVKVTKAIEQEFVCAICQELFIRALTLSCSHSFCEWCMNQWMSKSHSPECPVCRSHIHQAPVRSLVIDNVIKRHVSSLPIEQRALRRTMEIEHCVAMGVAPPPPEPDHKKREESSLGSAEEPIVIAN